eukprot:TsM_000268100 transcript=TsM_000268100 gene=TsM_000268100
MLSIEGLFRRYVWFGRLHVMTGTFFLTALGLLTHLVCIIICSNQGSYLDGTWRSSLYNYLSFITFVQWEQLASDAYKPQIFVSGFNASHTFHPGNTYSVSYGKNQLPLYSGTAEKLSKLDPSLLHLLSYQCSFIGNLGTMLTIFAITIVLMIAILTRSALFMLPYIFLQLIDFAFTFVAVVIYFWNLSDLVLCLNTEVCGYLFAAFCLHFRTHSLYVRYGNSVMCLKFQKVWIPYTVGAIGALTLVVKCILLLLILACHEYLVIFHEFGFVLEDSMVARLVRHLSSLVHLPRSFRVRSGKSGVLSR